ncbi:MAG: GAF domain-containing protein [Actinophytocola sp.]|nr:GAF domain-containing protein [Actinophytocola sp.]
MTTDLAADTAVTGHLRRSLRELSQLDGLSASLGGLVSAGGNSLVLSELHNLGSDLLRGALIRPGIGLGGVAMQQRRPVAVEDYVGSNAITHQFDRAVEADRLRSAIALPVLVKGKIRAVVYGATRGEMTFGDRTVETATVIARRLAHDIQVEEEVQQRLLAIKAELAERTFALPTAAELAEVNAELVAIADAVHDPGLRERVVNLSHRLSGRAAGRTARAMVQLSKREADVLGQLAAGHTNAEIAEQLSILPTTVKTHLRSTMRKLGARNRVETVVAARHAGLLP